MMSRGWVRRVATRRSVSYMLPQIPLLETLRSKGQDFGGLYLNRTINELWFQRGQHIVDRLNSQLEENKVANTPANLEELIAATFNKPELAGVFSQALMLHNLQFCLELLRPSDETQFRAEVRGVGELLRTPSAAVEVANAPQDELREWIVDMFGSVAELRTLMLNSAHGIHGDGIVWLVAQSSYSARTMLRGNVDLSYNTLAVMNTYNAGTVDDSVRSGHVAKLKRQQAAKADAAKRLSEERREIGEDAEEVAEAPRSSVHLGTVEEAEEALLYTDHKLVPLLALDASMRSYVGDYGVFGKRQYLENAWERIDWDVVEKRAPRRFKPSVVFDR